MKFAVIKDVYGYVLDTREINENFDYQDFISVSGCVDEEGNAILNRCFYEEVEVEEGIDNVQALMMAWKERNDCSIAMDNGRSYCSCECHG